MALEYEDFLSPDAARAGSHWIAPLDTTRRAKLASGVPREMNLLNRIAWTARTYPTATSTAVSIAMLVAGLLLAREDPAGLTMEVLGV